jgi:Fic family protein
MGNGVILPNHVKVPILMSKFCDWLISKNKIYPVEFAARAHYDLVTIHPFIDSNGRTARLLMNLILMQNGYPPAIIKNEDSLDYITSLEKAQLANAEGDSLNDYLTLIAKSVDRSLDIYLNSI